MTGNLLLGDFQSDLDLENFYFDRRFNKKRLGEKFDFNSVKNSIFTNSSNGPLTEEDLKIMQSFPRPYQHTNPQQNKPQIELPEKNIENKIQDPMICKFCIDNEDIRIFANVSILENHIINNHPKYFCQQCDYLFNDLKKSEEHFHKFCPNRPKLAKKISNRPKKIPAEKISTQEKSTRKIQKNFLGKKNQSDSIRSILSKIPSHPNNMWPKVLLEPKPKIIASISPTKPKCSLCVFYFSDEKIYDNFDALKYHVINVHPLYFCSPCNLLFDSPQNTYKHYNTHHYFVQNQTTNQICENFDSMFKLQKKI